VRRVEIGHLVDQRPAVEMSRENALEHCQALSGTELIEAESNQVSRGHSTMSVLISWSKR